MRKISKLLSREGVMREKTRQGTWTGTVQTIYIRVLPSRAPNNGRRQASPSPSVFSNPIIHVGRLLADELVDKVQRIA